MWIWRQFLMCLCYRWWAGMLFPYYSAGIMADENESDLWLHTLTFIVLFCRSHGTYTQTNWQSYVSVHEYHTYSSGQLLEYSIPPHSLTTAWLFTAYRSPSTCDERTLVIFMQHGSFPLINPLNETFPEDFNLERSHLKHISMKTDNRTLLYQFNHPLPGSWYAIAYLGDYIDDKITQKGIGVTCSYSLGVTHVAEAVDSVPVLVTNVVLPIINITKSSEMYRFHIGDKTWQYKISLYNCSYTVMPGNDTDPQNISSPCPLSIAVRSRAIPLSNDASTHFLNCQDQNECYLVYTSPDADTWQYMIIMPEKGLNVSANLHIQTYECLHNWQEESPTPRPTPLPVSTTTASTQPLEIREEMVTSTNLANNTFSKYAVLSNTTEPRVDAQDIIDTMASIVEALPKLGSNDECYIVPELGRMATANRPFRVRFYMHAGIIALVNRMEVTDSYVSVVKFHIEPVVDSGGTLRLLAAFHQLSMFNSSVEFQVTICIQKHRIPMDSSGVFCSEANKRYLNSSEPHQAVLLYFPYPEPGSWYITMQAQCFSAGPRGTSVLARCPPDLIVIDYDLELSPCLDGGCGQYGSCREYFSGVLHFSSCKCIAKYQGYACNDDTDALTDGEQLRSTLLLTLSNLLFIPAILVALYRRFFVEGLVYFYTMFFSTFYHACDGDNRFLYCMMPYNVLGHCDFFGAIMSFWVTLVAMARLPERLRAVAFMLAALGLAVGVTWDRHSLYTFLVPCAVALTGMLLSWMYRCHQRRECYPSKLRWLLFLLPGVLIAILGLIIFAFLETQSNYEYTHSAWHACMALCLVFILPPRRQSQKQELTESPENESTASNITLVRCDQGVYGEASPTANTSQPAHISDHPTPQAEPEPQINGKAYPV